MDLPIFSITCQFVGTKESVVRTSNMLALTEEDMSVSIAWMVFLIRWVKAGFGNKIVVYHDSVISHCPVAERDLALGSKLTILIECAP